MPFSGAGKVQEIRLFRWRDAGPEGFGGKQPVPVEFPLSVESDRAVTGHVPAGTVECAISGDGSVLVVTGAAGAGQQEQEHQKRGRQAGAGACDRGERIVRLLADATVGARAGEPGVGMAASGLPGGGAARVVFLAKRIVFFRKMKLFMVAVGLFGFCARPFPRIGNHKKKGPGCTSRGQ